MSEIFEVSDDGENWHVFSGPGAPKPFSLGGTWRYSRKAEPSQPVIGHVTPLRAAGIYPGSLGPALDPLFEARVTAREQLAAELRGEAKARATFLADGAVGPLADHKKQQAQHEHIMQFFEWEHLTGEARSVSTNFRGIALWIVDNLPRNPERTVALRKLLEAKDAAVRAAIAKP